MLEAGADLGPQLGIFLPIPVVQPEIRGARALLRLLRALPGRKVVCGQAWVQEGDAYGEDPVEMFPHGFDFDMVDGAITTMPARAARRLLGRAFPPRLGRMALLVRQFLPGQAGVHGLNCACCRGFAGGELLPVPCQYFGLVVDGGVGSALTADVTDQLMRTDPDTRRCAPLGARRIGRYRVSRLAGADGGRSAWDWPADVLARAY